MTNEEFYNEIAKLGIQLTNIQKNQLEEYYNMLIEWNNKINLTRILDKKDVYLKHFYDSITLFRDVNLKENVSICDIGTGAGFPGMVLKIVFPTLSVTLVDALDKRIKFLNEVIKKLELKNIYAIHDRGEIFARNNREKYDVVTSRAVSNLAILSEISIPLLKVNGIFVAMKANLNDEIECSKKILLNLNATIIKIDEFKLPIEESIRNLVIIRKDKITNLKYPRNFDKMKKSY